MRRRSSSRTSPFRLAGALGALAVMGSVSTASARSWFPGWIQDYYGTGCAPQCTLCHTSPLGGAGTQKDSPEFYVDGADKPSHRGYGVFIANLQNAGAGSVSTLGGSSKDQEIFNAKLKALGLGPCQHEAAKGNTTDPAACDSDGDGTLDTVELAAGNDPDTVGAGPECPKYGCGASIGSLPHDADTSGRAGAVMAALGVVLVLARRFRR